jgi:6-phosphogluconolactonase
LNPSRRSFGSKEDLALALSEAVADDIKQGCQGGGIAAIAVSGGSTPAKFFSALGRRKELDWDRVIVTLVDERWVPETSDRSNAGLVNMKLLQGPAASARFVPLYAGGEEPDEAALARAAQQLELVPGRFAAVVLGMGNDGHTASFFPGGDNLSAALTSNAPVVAMHAPGAGEARVTLTLSRLLKTDALYLHIEGEEKAKVLEMALAEGPVEEMPIRAILRQDQVPLNVYWSP